MDHYMFSHENSPGGASDSQATTQPVRDDDTLADSMARRLEEQAAAARDVRARQEDINQQLVQQSQGIGDQLRQLSRVALESLESHQPTPGQPTADNSDEPSETTTEPLPREATNDLHSNVRLKEPDTFSGQ